MSVRRNISISNEVDNHIKKFMPERTFSTWVEERYKEEFMDLDNKIKNLQILKEQVTKLEEEVKSLQENRNFVVDELTQDKIGFLLDVRKRIRNGAVMEGVCSLYNNIFVESFDVWQFASIVKEVEKRYRK